MKKIGLLSFLALTVVALATLVGCSEYDNGYNEKSFSFKKEFVETFGEIDPKQDWNLAERGNVTVETSTTKDIKVYAEQSGTFTLLANYRSVSGSQLLEFDINRNAENIVVSNGDTALRARIGGYVSFDDLISTDLAALSTRSHNVNRNEWPSQFVIPAMVTEEEIAKVVKEFSKVHYGAYNTVTVPWDAMWVQQVYGGANNYVDGNGNAVNSLAKMNNLQIYNNNKGNGSGPTSDSGLEGFEHINDFNASSHFSSYKDDKVNIVGTTLMWDIDPTGVPTEEVTLDDKTLTWVKQFAYHNACDSKYHAEYIMKVVDGQLYLGFDFYATHPEGQEVNKNMDVERDWVFNDWIIKVSRAFSSTGVPQAVLRKAQTTSWVLAAEDMGGTGDVDYNDVVVKVQHIAGSKSATVTPLAAGGTLASYLFFNDKCYGEIHQLLGAQPAVSGRYPVLNVGAATAANALSQQVEVGENWSLSCYSVADWNMSKQSSQNMGGFSIRVLPNGTEPPATAPQNINDPIFGSSEVSVVQGPTPGDAPYILCVPFLYANVDLEAATRTSYPWAWPNERKYIVDAYTDFAGWVQDHTGNTDWYTKPNSGFVFNTSAMGTPESLQPQVEELTEEEIEATQEAYENLVVVQEYPVNPVPTPILKLKEGVTAIEVSQNDQINVLDYIDTNYPEKIFCISQSTGAMNYVGEKYSPILKCEESNSGETIVKAKLAMSGNVLELDIPVYYNKKAEKPAATITLSDANSMMEGTTKTVTINSNSTGAFTSASTQNGGIFEVTLNGSQLTIKALKAGNDNIIITQAATDTYKETTNYIWMQVYEKPASTMSASASSSSIQQGGTTTINLNKSTGGNVTYSVSPSNAGTMNGNTFTASQSFEGTATITVNQAETDQYKAGSASVSVVVKKQSTGGSEFGSPIELRNISVTDVWNQTFVVSNAIPTSELPSGAYEIVMVYEYNDNPYNYGGNFGFWGFNNGTAETTTQVSTGTATIQNDKIVITYPFAPNIGYTHLRWNLNNAAYIDNDKHPLVGIYVRSISSAKRR